MKHNHTKVNTFLQRMDMFGTMDKRNSHSRTSKGRRDDNYSGLLKKSDHNLHSHDGKKKRSSNGSSKSKIMSKLKGTSKNISLNS